MNRVSAAEIAWRLETLYSQNVMSLPQYNELVHGCKKWFGRAFENEAEFNERYLLSDDSFVNVLGACLGSERKMLDFLCVCDRWAFWHFNFTIHSSIQTLKSQGAEVFYVAPTSDVQFLKKFALLRRCSIG